MIYSPGSSQDFVLQLQHTARNQNRSATLVWRLFQLPLLPPTFYQHTEPWPKLGLNNPQPQKTAVARPKNIWGTWHNEKITNGTCILSRHGLLKTHQIVILHTWFLTSILLVCIMERSYNNNTFCHGNICSMKSIIHLFFFFSSPYL